MAVAERHATLKSLLRKRPPAESGAHYFEVDRFPALVATASFPEMRDFRSSAAPMREMSGGKWRWCEDCCMHIRINDENDWQSHIFHDDHFDASAKRSSFAFDSNHFVNHFVQLPSLPVEDPPRWVEFPRSTEDPLLVQTHCEYGVEFIVGDTLQRKYVCVVCFTSHSDNDGAAVVRHCRSYDHITRSLEKKNPDMIALLSDQTDMEARKAILLEYCQHCNIEKDSRIRVYDPIEATRLNCCGVVPMRLLELSQAEPGPSREVAVILQQMVDQLSGDANAAKDFCRLNDALLSENIEIRNGKGDCLLMWCRDCRQTFSMHDAQRLKAHLLSGSHWRRRNELRSTRINENNKTGEASIFKIPPFPQTQSKPVAWMWNKSSEEYEFVYSQLALDEIIERRVGNRVDFFCNLCAHSVTHGQKELEQHVRSFEHVLYYIHKHRPNVIPQLEQMLEEHLPTAAKQQNIRKLFARALKGTNTEVGTIMVYNFGQKPYLFPQVATVVRQETSSPALLDCQFDLSRPKERPPATWQYSLQNVGLWQRVKAHATTQLNKVKIEIDQDPLLSETASEVEHSVMEAARAASPTSEMRKPPEKAQIVVVKQEISDTSPQSRRVEPSPTMQSPQTTATSQAPPATVAVTPKTPPAPPKAARPAHMKKIKPLPADELPQTVEPEPARPVAQIEPAPRMQHLQQSLVSTAHSSAMDALVQSAAQYAATRTTGAQVAPPSGGEADMEMDEDEDIEIVSTKIGKSRTTASRWSAATGGPPAHAQPAPPAPSTSQPPTMRTVEQLYSQYISNLRKTNATQSTTASASTSDSTQVTYATSSRPLGPSVPHGRQAPEATKEKPTESSSRSGHAKSRSPRRHRSRSRSADRRRRSRSPRRGRSRSPTRRPISTVVLPIRNRSRSRSPGRNARRPESRSRSPHPKRTSSPSSKDRSADGKSKSKSKKKDKELEKQKEKSKKSEKDKEKSKKDATAVSSSLAAEVRSTLERLKKNKEAKDAPPPVPKPVPPPQPVPPPASKPVPTSAQKPDGEDASSSDSEMEMLKNAEQSFMNKVLAARKKPSIQIKLAERHPESAKDASEYQLRNAPNPVVPGMKPAEMARLSWQQAVHASEAEQKQERKSRFDVSEEQRQRQQELEHQQQQAEAASSDRSTAPAPAEGQRGVALSKLNDYCQTMTRILRDTGLAKSIEAIEAITTGVPPTATQAGHAAALSHLPQIAVCAAPSLSSMPPTTTTASDVMPPSTVVAPIPQPGMPASSAQQQQLLSQQLPGIQAILAQLAEGQSPTYQAALLQQLQQLQMSQAAAIPTTHAAPLYVPSVPPPNMAIPPPNLSIPPPNLVVPPPSMAGAVSGWPNMNVPPPMMQPAQASVHSAHLEQDGQIIKERMETFAPALERVGSIKELVEFFVRHGYEQIPAYVPPLLFNEIVAKRKGFLGVSYLFQVICYARPDLETYYCGMCNHWTTVSEMFLHLRSSMHRLNYMNKGYKMYYKRLMEQPDEEKRDEMLDKLAEQIWKIDGSGKCTNRMNCIITEPVMRKIWPDYGNYVDNSWKIMEDDDIQLLPPKPAPTEPPLGVSAASLGQPTAVVTPAAPSVFQQQQQIALQRMLQTAAAAQQAAQSQQEQRAIQRAQQEQSDVPACVPGSQAQRAAATPPTAVMEEKSGRASGKPTEVQRPSSKQSGKRDKEDKKPVEAHERKKRSRSPTSDKDRRRHKSKSPSRRRSRSKSPRDSSRRKERRRSRSKDRSSRRGDSRTKSPSASASERTKATEPQNASGSRVKYEMDERVSTAPQRQQQHTPLDAMTTLKRATAILVQMQDVYAQRRYHKVDRATFSQICAVVGLHESEAINHPVLKDSYRMFVEHSDEGVVTSTSDIRERRSTPSSALERARSPTARGADRGSSPARPSARGRSPARAAERGRSPARAPERAAVHSPLDRERTLLIRRNPEDERRTVTLTGGAYTQDELRRYEISESRKRRLEPVAPADEYEARRRREMPPLTQEQYNSPHRYDPPGGRGYPDERMRVEHDDRRRAEDDRRRAEPGRSGHRDRREDPFRPGVPPEAQRRAAVEWGGGYPPAGSDAHHRHGSSRDDRIRRPPGGGPPAHVEVVTLDDDWDSLETLASNLLGR